MCILSPSIQSIQSTFSPPSIQLCFSQQAVGSPIISAWQVQRIPLFIFTWFFFDIWPKWLSLVSTLASSLAYVILLSLSSKSSLVSPSFVFMGHSFFARILTDGVSQSSSFCLLTLYAFSGWPHSSPLRHLCLELLFTTPLSTFKFVWCFCLITVL